MSYDSISTLHDVFAVLAIIAMAGAVLMVAARLIPSVASVRFLDALYRVQLPLAALVAITATSGSLFMSEFGEHWIPCRWCWFQRIFMYSLAVVLLVAAIRRDRGVKWFAVPLAVIGICTSLWHILIEHRVVEESSACFTVQSCANPWRVSFGTLDFSTGTLVTSGMPITLAVMAFCGFAAILALLLTPEPLNPEPLDPHQPEADQDGQSSAS
ncbi:MAG: disulfide bond formation protein B [Acidimicrobiaceae bacterium]|jgi:disulfide bond formation protein DsbB|nr:disulfide bond formation protein B [Acidimicrobiaceae bacterium]MBP6486906.1 disulfide bond formation protein B [Ilumatobacteraceae bacterium]MBK9972872.1 disulfide bond formation protein B [Acidimicrobiaceae bacterium]MBP7889261.1 disulfide bond formation protein B [Ilumatobacteraceae bacterium]MBP9052775.1 disulfide bond formation protein B [Ilumatobacteraceae bacterium]